METWTEADPDYRPSDTDRFTNMIGNHGTTQDNHPSMFEFKDWLKDMSARIKTILSERWLASQVPYEQGIMREL